MSVTLKGAPQLKARMNALKLAFKLIGKSWAEQAADNMRPMVPVKTGKLRASFRVKSATKTRAVVGGWYTAYFIDAGTKAHAIQAKKGALIFKGRHGTVFAKQAAHPGTRAQPFRARAAHAALEDNPLGPLVDLWNSAA